MKPQIDTDGVTVWVNAIDGYCLGRFGSRGIDVHCSPFLSVDVDGKGECLYCTHDVVTVADWDVFKEKMSAFHNVVVTDKYIPKRFRT